MTNPDSGENPYASPQTPSFAPGAIWPPPGAEPCAPCPQCGNVYARKIDFTWWGGLLGPRILNHVKCLQCGQTYNSKTGRSNFTAIVLYQVITLLIIALLFAAFTLA
jgi:hypothetical protein